MLTPTPTEVVESVVGQTNFAAGGGGGGGRAGVDDVVGVGDGVIVGGGFPPPPPPPPHAATKALTAISARPCRGMRETFTMIPFGDGAAGLPLSRHRAKLLPMQQSKRAYISHERMHL